MGVDTTVCVLNLSFVMKQQIEAYPETTMNIEDRNARARLLASKGLTAAEIWHEHFPKSNYLELFAAVHNIADPSAAGVRRHILENLPHLKSIIEAAVPGSKIV